MERRGLPRSGRCAGSLDGGTSSRQLRLFETEVVGWRAEALPLGGPPGRPPVAGLTHSGVGPPPRPGASFWARSPYTFGVPRALSWHGAGVLANGWDNSRLFAMEFRGHGGLGNPRSTATLSDLFRAVPSRAETRRAGPILPSRQSRAEPGQAGPSRAVVVVITELHRLAHGLVLGAPSSL